MSTLSNYVKHDFDVFHEPDENWLPKNSHRALLANERHLQVLQDRRRQVTQRIEMLKDKIGKWVKYINKFNWLN